MIIIDKLNSMMNPNSIESQFLTLIQTNKVILHIKHHI